MGAFEGLGGGAVVGDGGLDGIEVAGSDEALVADGGVAGGDEVEFPLLEAGVGAHACRL